MQEKSAATVHHSLSLVQSITINSDVMPWQFNEEMAEISLTSSFFRSIVFGITVISLPISWTGEWYPVDMLNRNISRSNKFIMCLQHTHTKISDKRVKNA